MSAALFISHSTKDAAKAKRIVALLEKSGLSCWVAPRDVRPGHDYDEEILEGIQSSSAMIVVLSRNANDSSFVKREVERAVAYRKQLFVIRIDASKPGRNLEFFLSTVHWADAAGGLEEAVMQLAREITRSFEGPGVPAAAAPSAAGQETSPAIGQDRFVHSLLRDDFAEDEEATVYTQGSRYRFRRGKGDAFLVSGGWFEKNVPCPHRTTIVGCVKVDAAEKDSIHKPFLAARGFCTIFGNGRATSEVRKIRLRKVAD